MLKWNILLNSQKMGIVGRDNTEHYNRFCYLYQKKQGETSEKEVSPCFFRITGTSNTKQYSP